MLVRFVTKLAEHSSMLVLLITKYAGLPTKRAESVTKLVIRHSACVEFISAFKNYNSFEITIPITLSNTMIT